MNTTLSSSVHEDDNAGMDLVLYYCSVYYMQEMYKSTELSKLQLKAAMSEKSLFIQISAKTYLNVM